MIYEFEKDGTTIFTFSDLSDNEKRLVSIIKKCVKGDFSDIAILNPLHSSESIIEKKVPDTNSDISFFFEKSNEPKISKETVVNKPRKRLPYPKKQKGTVTMGKVILEKIMRLPKNSINNYPFDNSNTFGHDGPDLSTLSAEKLYDIITSGEGLPF